MSVASQLAALREKVHGDPAAIRAIAAGLRTAGDHASTSTNRLPKYVAEVGKAWQGDSATAFAGYMAAYPKAGSQLDGALDSCAKALDTAASTLESAYNTIDGLHRTAQSAESAYQGKHSDATQEQIDAHVRGQFDADPVTEAGKQVTRAQKALTTAKEALDGQLGDGFGFFKGIRAAGGADFDPGEKKVDWRKIGSYHPTTKFASTGDPGGPGGTLGGDGGGAGGGVGAPSSYGSAPAPKPQVVEWIKQALTVIRSPEMAAIMRQRGLNVSDLDPNDPQDIQRIWTIIFHESGGRPDAINLTDINAKNGVPSQGLMQTIPPTFKTHHLPGYDKIREPVDNIIAGVLYTYSRYGNLAGHPGIRSLESGGGYKPY
ncbi:WXG100 family type VII secretion target [Nonomuraea sp. NPDC048882]|uniref:transglycosylase SLT domain-containing protein n=1 Tax=Nonomuraea sp. NPDC048882 TaxID=3154347 RepID=UPI0033DFE8BD